MSNPSQPTWSVPDLDPRRGPVPATRFLANDAYTVLITAAGTGCSTYTSPDGNKGSAWRLTPWQGDRVSDPHGFFIYLRDLLSADIWSASRKPCRGTAGDGGTGAGARTDADAGDPEAVDSEDSHYQASWRPGLFAITRFEHGIESILEICVAPHHPAELRRLTLVNRSRRRRVIDVTSFAEIVLDDPRAHAAHPVFSKLFVQTEHVPAAACLLARRRPRAPGERAPWLVHACISGASSDHGLPQSHETNRARFLGRGCRRSRPRSLARSASLTGTTGNVLDPCLSQRRVVALDVGQQARLTFMLGAADSRAAAVALAEHFHGEGRVAHAINGARARAEIELERLGLQVQQAEYYQALAGAMLYGHPGLRAAPEILARTVSGPDGIDVDACALAVLHIDHDPDNIPPHSPHAHLVAAHMYWQTLGLPLELVTIANGRRDRTQLTPTEIERLEASAGLVVCTALPDLPRLEQRGQLPSSRRFLPPSADRTGAGSVPGSEKPVVNHENSGDECSDPISATEELKFFNGYGGFSADGREYVIRLARSETTARPCVVAEDGPGLTFRTQIESDTAPPAHTPQPWINVIANENFGCLVSESGAGYTWRGNSREHRLTPWFNDPVLDPPGEALYIRDEDAGRFWSPLPGPVTRAAPYEMRHGFGYSRCRHISHELVQETTICVHRHDPVKFTVIRLTNRSDRKRSLSIFAYAQLVLGGSSADSSRFVVTRAGEQDGSMLAWNRFATDHAESVAFAIVSLPPGAKVAGITGDRAAFVGPDGSLGRPAAVTASDVLDGHTGAGLDPCFAQQVQLELTAGQELEVVFLLGEADSLAEAHDLGKRHGAAGMAAAALGEMQRFWQDHLSALQIHTPSESLDLLVNGWLPYQTLSCRVWGRSAFYQSGGAFGFRDQLQDAGALIYQWPELTRAQILLHAAHQFHEGDVLHWWHPPRSRGIRTRFADDLLWLPLLTSFYLRVTGEQGILDEWIPYLRAPLLATDQDEVFLQPEDSGEAATLYDHCCRAIDHSLVTGRHGLPLFGTGDWNDGMNRVGRQGKGESVWMGFFLSTILNDFIPVCEQRQDRARAERYDAHRQKLHTALNEHGWDGQWYRRGYYDNGQPLGSHECDECQIDALAQAWAVLSGVAPAERAAQALQAVERRLVSTDDKLIRLLTPPFADTPNDPGYIKGYVQGVRENGGQYTHAALWFVQAMARLGRNDRVAALLDLLNPINHALTVEQVSVYQVEPYVVAADVYGEPPHVGRGGWTWYTGSSGWMHRVALESLLGFQISEGRTLVLKPCVPDNWPRLAIDYRLPGEETRYEIRIENPHGRAQVVTRATCDGEAVACTVEGCRVPLRHDGRAHRVELTLGPRKGR